MRAVCQALLGDKDTPVTGQTQPLPIGVQSRRGTDRELDISVGSVKTDVRVRFCGGPM